MQSAKPKVNSRLISTEAQGGEDGVQLGKAAQTRLRLLIAAREAFATAGYGECGLREIASAAGVNVALVKRYFGSKEALFEEALSGVLGIEMMVSCPREQFGAHMAELLSTIGVHTLPMMLFATSDPTARDVSLKLLDRQLIAPLGEWLGQPDGEARAVKIIILCSGFATHLRLLPLSGATDPDVKHWMARELQRIVDEA